MGATALIQSKIKRPVLRYFGGKFLLAPWIISQMPPHRVYVEPYGGAASVLMRKPRSYAEVYNDLDGEVVSLFKILRDPTASQELERRLRMTPFSRDEFDAAYGDAVDEIESARFLIIRAFMGFGSDGHNISSGKTGFRANSNRSGTTPAHDWAGWPQHIASFTSRLSGVVIENRDAAKIIAQQDGPETLFYVDPPYVHETRGAKHGYRHELSNEDHDRLLKILGCVEGMVMLSGYDTEKYNALGWHKVTKATKADGARSRTECLWFNDAAKNKSDSAGRDLTLKNLEDF